MAMQQRRATVRSMADVALLSVVFFFYRRWRNLFFNKKNYKFMEKILSIKETTFKTDIGGYNDNYEGFEIKTNKQTIKVGIDNSQCCCEDFGCLMTEDNTNDFINRRLISIKVVDTALNNKKIDRLEYLGEGDAMFVNFETDNGLFQIVAYNSHNGHYGHSTVLISKQLTKTMVC